eukprot:scaffold8431_cov248-Pinguiococcus_pyrenoidosus.AAC.9
MMNEALHALRHRDLRPKRRGWEGILRRKVAVRRTVQDPRGDPPHAVLLVQDVGDIRLEFTGVVAEAL